MQPLKLGVAYHGNRMPHHAWEDLRDIAVHDGDLVVHMFSHTDWDRHKTVMRDLVSMTQELGMEVWVDNWGLGGPPGDKSHFLSYYPDCHVTYSDGTLDPVRACLNAPDFRRFTREWIDAVQFLGAETIFWDEPHLPMRGSAYACACPRCRKLFEERYGHPMPQTCNSEVEAFRLATIVDYFREVTAYSREKGMKNVACVMLGDGIGINLDSISAICSLETLDNIGSDPYWYGRADADPFGFVYEGTKKNLAVSDRFGKDHNIWIQGFGVPRGREEEIVTAMEAAYDAGARTILTWGYYGCESNDYRARNPEKTRAATFAAMRRVRDMERDRILAEARLKYRK